MSSVPNKGSLSIIRLMGRILAGSKPRFGGRTSDMPIIKPSVFLLPNIISARFPIAGTNSGFSSCGGVYEYVKPCSSGRLRIISRYIIFLLSHPVFDGRLLNPPRQVSLKFHHAKVRSGGKLP